ncbi:protein adenylyltransferase SelO [Nonlabens marinus]|uniref:Protein nucleotidyltransferase YdiU n=1 Tax=Nonlabens marinus S1-08 TaxID=1454201 RepID=W8VW27_9FLAO|nr:YdiU family protein [Nonlabens marinus]BAO55963.1 selenoprotein O and cysteine-containing homologs [Nonlabens marinus S1-08]
MTQKITTSFYIEKLPVDPVYTNKPRQVLEASISFVQPEKFENAELIHVSMELASELGFTEDDTATERFKDALTGQWTPGSHQAFAMNYGGFQFGQWAGQLGDGRAINIGEVAAKKNVQQLQLKGAGPTPYSRRGDGFAVLRSSIREHLCSEAMHYLGIPTTRSLSLALSGDEVMRDMFYDHHPALEKGAIVCRIAPSFLRFGNFQLPASRGEEGHLKKLLDFTIKHHFKNLDFNSSDRYIQFFKQVTDSTLEMIIHWQRVGFVHGVMNTDNMSILGLTIDYGPYGWLEDYNPNWTPNTTDNQHKRYRYGAQPEIALWNLWQLANAIYPLIGESERLEAVLNEYKKNYQEQHLQMMRSKLGLIKHQPEDLNLITQLLELLPKHETDMTIFFRELSGVNKESKITEAFEGVHLAFYNLNELQPAVKQEWNNWLSLYVKRLNEESASAAARLSLMQRTNPKYVLRNYMAQLAIDKADQGDYSLISEFYEMLKNPYDDQPKYNQWYKKRPDWARDKPGSSQLSCSS